MTAMQKRIVSFVTLMVNGMILKEDRSVYVSTKSQTFNLDNEPDFVTRQILLMMVNYVWSKSDIKITRRYWWYFLGSCLPSCEGFKCGKSK